MFFLHNTLKELNILILGTVEKVANTLRKLQKKQT